MTGDRLEPSQQAMLLTEEAYHLLGKAEALLRLEHLQRNAKRLQVDYPTTYDDQEGDTNARPS